MRGKAARKVSLRWGFSTSSFFANRGTNENNDYIIIDQSDAPNPLKTRSYCNLKYSKFERRRKSWFLESFVYTFDVVKHSVKMITQDFKKILIITF